MISGGNHYIVSIGYMNLASKSLFKSSLTKRKQGFFTRKINEKVPKMAAIRLDQGAILDKLF
jgi:hypothetical protein